MAESATETGLLVCVDGSPASDAAVAWATREAVMRQLPITLLHVVEQIVVGWPVGQMFLEMPQWQKENAQHVIDRALEIFSATLGDSDSPQVHTEVVYSKAVQL
ncbi:MAG: hypothetical protein QOD58_3011 [Mycobacterium sp.]|nr:hypothetical protein [Mycobacterium sp.]